MKAPGVYCKERIHFSQVIEKLEHFLQFFKKCWAISHPLSGTPTPHDLPLNLGICPGKFGDASYYRDRMHKEQTNKHSQGGNSRYQVPSYDKKYRVGTAAPSWYSDGTEI